MEEKLSPNIVSEVLKSSFPKQNDYGDSDYIEELDELLRFGIKTKDQLENLITSHKNKVLEIDSESLDEQHIEWYRDDEDIENLDDKIKNQYWFALPGLLRISLELEFGDEYRKFADERDGI